MLADKDSCIGCSACAAACPTKAISMIRDENEFLFPTVSEKVCISCGQCIKACPILNPSVPKRTHNLAVFSGHYTKIEKNLRSSSGGFVSALSEAIISAGGTVYGVCYNEGFSRAIYARASSIEQLEPMKGSKYIFSELSSEIYESISADLRSEKSVLFVGCPCEVYAVSNFFGDRYDNLITCELICQGGSSPKALRIFVQELEETYNSKVKYLNMRAKRNGNAHPYMMMAVMASGDVFFEPLGNTDFDIAFRNIKRESCYNCNFKMPNDVADFTAGDHIGMSESDPCYFESGVSIIFVHNNKAMTWIKRIENFTFMDETFERGAGIQNCLFNSIEKSVFYDQIVSWLNENKLKGSAELIDKRKAELLEKPLFDLSNRVKKQDMKFVIWGVGKYFENAYKAIKKNFPDGQIVAIIDKYKTGEKHNIRIVSPDKLPLIDFDHVVISTVAGQKEATVAVSQCVPGSVKQNCSLVMLPSDIKE